MTEFKTHFRLYRTIFLLLTVTFWLISFVYLLFFISNNNLENLELFGFIVLTLIFAFSTYSFIKILIKICASYTVRKDEIEMYNFFTLKRKTILKIEILGFSKSWSMAKGRSYDLIIIYLKNGNKIIFHELDYFNHNDIKPNLTKFGYEYLGHEPEVFKGFFKRVYKFDK
jgi:hypothetical protein